MKLRLMSKQEEVNIHLSIVGHLLPYMTPEQAYLVIMTHIRNSKELIDALNSECK